MLIILNQILLKIRLGILNLSCFACLIFSIFLMFFSTQSALIRVLCVLSQLLRCCLLVDLPRAPRFAFALYILIFYRGADTSAFGLFLAQVYGPYGVLLLLAGSFVWRLSRTICHILLNTLVQSCSILAAIGQAGCIIGAHGTVVQGQAALDRVNDRMTLLLWGTGLR